MGSKTNQTKHKSNKIELLRRRHRVPLLPRHKRLERLVRGCDVQISAAKHVEGVYAKLTHAVHLGGWRVANLKPRVAHQLTHSPVRNDSIHAIGARLKRQWINGTMDGPNEWTK